MSYYADGRELERQLIRTVTSFLDSADGQEAVARLRGSEQESAVLTVALSEPEVTLCIDFLRGRATSDRPDVAPDVEIEMPADTLHDLLLERLDPVQISRMYETDVVRFRGNPWHLGAMVMLASPLSRHYRATLQIDLREDLLATPVPATQVVWGDPSEAVSPRPMLSQRRPWQRQKRAARTAG